MAYTLEIAGGYFLVVADGETVADYETLEEALEYIEWAGGSLDE